MGDTKQEMELAAARLDEELAQCHDCTMSAFRFAAATTSYDIRLEVFKTATRMMQAQAAAALALQRLRSDNAHHTYTYVHEGRAPTPQKSKTNVPAKNGQATDA